MPRSVRILFVTSLALLGVGVAVFLVGGYFLWYDGVRTLVKQNADLENKLVDAKKKVEELPRLRIRLAGLKARQRALEHLIPPDDYKSKESFIEAVKLLIFAAGAKLNDIKESQLSSSAVMPGTAPLPQGVKKIGMEFQVTGDFDQVTRLMDSLEHGQRLFILEDFDYRMGGREAGVLNLKLGGYVNATAYKLLEPFKTQYHGKTTLPPR